MQYLILIFLCKFGCAQNSNAMSRILPLQKKAMRIIDFHSSNCRSRNCRSSRLFSKLKLLKLNGKVLLEMCFWSVNLLIVFWSSTIGSLFSPIFITVKQPHPLLINFHFFNFILKIRKYPVLVKDCRFVIHFCLLIYL